MPKISKPNNVAARNALAASIQNGSQKLTSDIIKSLLFEYFRFERKMLGVMSEMHLTANNYEDIVAFNRDEIISVEIKLTIEDFQRDFFKKKWQLGNLRCNRFYFCVPNDVAIEIYKRLFEKNIMVGLIVVKEDLSLEIVRSAKLLQPKSDIFAISQDESQWNKGQFVNDNLAYYLIQRMSAELASAKMIKKF